MPHARPETIEYPPVLASGNKFSLAGVQMKFSMKEKDGRYNLIHSAVSDGNEELGEWIIKTPSTQHAYVPLNEFSAMQLAALAGIDMPETRLVALDTLDNLPAIRLPEEPMAFGIKRFDRQRGLQGTERVHMEDFAQVLAKYPHEKYGSASYDQIGRILYQFSGDAIADAQQFARRLLVNILLANGDAHLKNWSLLYSDRYTPRLSPAYDIVTTSVYMDNERTTALNLAGQKAWYQTSMESYQQWAKKADIPWRLIKPHLDDTLDKARSLWPQALAELPMHEPHKQALREHWQRLHTDFRLLGG
ncbi:type II toxin-antitoxin system HipA family toxin [Halomonas sp. R57-5]|uniref:type II toxin-antitoxin system HipA family toxin n=1 Tax=Halomonas sp. R57-5 TaxID=1610576 RepID=UPI003FA567BA